MVFCRPSYFRRNRCCVKLLYSACYSCVVLVVFLTVYMMVKSELHTIDDSLVQLSKCPVCFGIWEETCQGIALGAVKIRENYFWRTESIKGVWYGVWDGFPVVVKQLGHSQELAVLDEKICLNTTSSKHCDVHEIVWRSFLNPALSFKSAIMKFMECPCDQFALLVENSLKSNKNVVLSDQKIMATTNLHFNHEFIFLQVFSKRYLNFLPAVYGACGRVVVVEYVGPVLSSVLDWSWLERVTLSIKLIQLAHAFTRTEENMALYMYDVALENFAVDKHGNVKLIDCEHILIVDMRNFNHTYVHKTEDFCGADQYQCLTFSPDDLCKGQAQDHNYYAICRNILAAIGGTKGLLHSPPLSHERLLKYLLHNCVYSKEMSREQAIEELETELYRYIGKKKQKG